MAILRGPKPSHTDAIDADLRLAVRDREHARAQVIRNLAHIDSCTTRIETLLDRRIAAAGIDPLDQMT